MKKILGLVIAILFIVGGIVVFFLMNQDATKNYQYKIEYHDGYNPGKTYEVYIQKNYNILVIKPPICVIEDCVEKDLNEKVTFSKENKEKIKTYIQEVMNGKKEIKLTATDLSSNELIVMESIIYNDEIHLESIMTEQKPVKTLLLELSSGRIDCDSVTLKVYDDNTYEYVESRNKEGESSAPKTGTYTYDVSKILTNNDKYTENEHGPYIIKTSSGESVNVYDSNQELNEFLKEIGLSLDVCINVK